MGRPIHHHRAGGDESQSRGNQMQRCRGRCGRTWNIQLSGRARARNNAEVGEEEVVHFTRWRCNHDFERKYDVE